MPVATAYVTYCKHYLIYLHTLQKNPKQYNNKMEADCAGEIKKAAGGSPWNRYGAMCVNDIMQTICAKTHLQYVNT